MSNILNFDNYINEHYTKPINDYKVGDEVMIRYYLTGDIVPVKLITQSSHNVFIVSFKVKDSPLFNAPDLAIKTSQIISRYRAVGEPIDNTERHTQNPKIRPDTSGLIPGWNSFNNDISF